MNKCWRGNFWTKKLENGQICLLQNKDNEIERERERWDNEIGNGQILVSFAGIEAKTIVSKIVL